MTDQHHDDDDDYAVEVADAEDPTGAPPDAGSREEHVTEAARQISETFLDAHPGRYFRTRAIRWAQTADQPADPEAPTWPSTEAGDQVKDRLGEGDYIDGRKTDVPAASTLDAFMLAHHAGESLMRHFLALLSATTNPHPVPWLEMVTLQQGPEFRQRLRVIIDASNETLDEAIEALLVPPELAAIIREEADRPSNEGPSDGEHTAESDDSDQDSDEDLLVVVHRFCRAWLRHFAGKFLHEGSGYNAAKHGLSTVTGYSQLAFHPDPDAWDGPGPVPDAQVVLEGPEIRTIEHNGAKGEARRWFTVTRHVDPPGLIAHTLIAADLLDWLWEIERARKLGTPAEIPVRTGPLPQDVIHGHYRAWGQFRLALGALPLPGPARDETLRKLGILDEPVDEAPE